LALGDAHVQAHQRGAGGGLGVQGVALALTAPPGPVGARDLDDGLAVGGQPAGQAGAPRAGPLDPEAADLAEAFGPCQQLGVALDGGGDGRAAKQAAQAVHGGGDVDIGVGVHTDGDHHSGVGVALEGARHPGSLHEAAAT